MLDTKNKSEQITYGCFYWARMFRHCVTAIPWQWCKSKLKRNNFPESASSQSAEDANYFRFWLKPFTPFSRSSQANPAFSKTPLVTLSPICICFEFPLFSLFYTVDDWLCQLLFSQWITNCSSSFTSRKHESSIIRMFWTFFVRRNSLTWVTSQFIRELKQQRRRRQWKHH